jgi:hypothetical protein
LARAEPDPITQIYSMWRPFQQGVAALRELTTLRQRHVAQRSALGG